MKKVGVIFIITLISAFLIQKLLFPNILSFRGNKRSRRNIVVIGGGLAGLSASITAASGELDDVYMLEKEARLGGNSAKATSGINGVFTEAQKVQGVDDSYESFIEDTIISGKGLSVENLVEVLVKKSTAAVSFLESFDIDLMTLSQNGGHSAKRTHRSDPNLVKRNVGSEIIFRLIEGTKAFSNLNVLLNTKVVSVKVAGEKNIVYYESEEDGMKIEGSIVADKVIFTTGGFAADQDGLIKKYKKDICTYPTTNGPHSKGEGLKVLEEMGAKIVDMDEIQVHPTGFINPNSPDDMKVFLAPECLRGGGGLLLKTPGERFVDELQLRDYVSIKINENCHDMFNNGRKISYLLLNEQSADSFGISKLNFYKSKGLIKEYNSVRELCEKEDGLEYEIVKETILEYERSMERGLDDFGKNTFPAKYTIGDKLFLAYITPSLHYTMGGARINEFAQVLDNNLDPIQTVYAAGEVTGGIHGKNRLAGNSLLECVVFGVIAGEQAKL